MAVTHSPLAWLATGLFIACCQAAYTDDAEAETLLLLHFDEDRGRTAHDASGNGHHGKVHGAEWVDGKFGKALRFDGERDYVTLGRREALDFGKKTDFTVECWVKIEPDVPQGFYFIVTNRLRTDMPGYSLLTHKYLHPIASVGDKVSSVQTLIGRKKLNDGKWHHLALTADRDGVASLYVDGGLVASSDMSHIVTVTNEKRPLLIGDRGYTGGFIGCIDEVRISRGVRTDFKLDRPYGDPIDR